MHQDPLVKSSLPEKGVLGELLAQPIGIPVLMGVLGCFWDLNTLFAKHRLNKDNVMRLNRPPR